MYRPLKIFLCIALVAGLLPAPVLAQVADASTPVPARAGCPCSPQDATAACGGCCATSEKALPEHGCGMELGASLCDCASKTTPPAAPAVPASAGQDRTARDHAGERVTEPAPACVAAVPGSSDAPRPAPGDVPWTPAPPEPADHGVWII